MAGDYTRCDTCGNYGWVESHRCPPEWQCRRQGESDDDWITVRASDAEEAAETAVEEFDQDDHHLMRGGTLEVEVRQLGAATITRWSVRGEAIPTYYAHELVTTVEPD